MSAVRKTQFPRGGQAAQGTERRPQFAGGALHKKHA
jgi:hypothetical protein